MARQKQKTTPRKPLLTRPPSFIYLLCLAYAVYNMIPTAEEKEEIRERKAMRAAGGGKGGRDDDASSDGATPTADKVVFEMIPPSRQHVLFQQGQGQQHGDSPFTPRTQAFHTLERKLPLRGY